MPEPNSFMLDSGAFSVWNSGAEIDLDVYINFCKQHPGVSYYVCLDKIPGKPGAEVIRTPGVLQDAAQSTWENYLRMIDQLPKEKVIPVFHRGEDFRWLAKYLEFGSPYVGFGQIGMGGSKETQKAFLREVSKYVLDSAGRLIVKTHGFAITSFQLMNYMPWHSVDSASWLKQAAFGVVYIPFRDKDGKYLYDRNPFLLNTSPKSPTRDDHGIHISTLTPTVRSAVFDYLASIRAKIGKFEVLTVPAGYKKPQEELWFDSKKTQVIRTIEEGLVTSHQHRFRANAAYIRQANAVLDVNHIYFAGGEGSVDDRVEYRLVNRLMSYHKIGSSIKTQGHAAFLKWTQTMTEESKLNV